MKKYEKKIVLVANTSWYLFNFRLNLMLHLVSLGYVVVAIAPRDSYSERFEQHGIKFYGISMDNEGTNPFKDSILILRFFWIFLRLAPVCVLSYTPKCNIYAGLATSLLSIPIINNISGLGTAFIGKSRITKIVKFLYFITLKKSAKVFFQNADDLALFIKSGLVKPQLTDLLPGSGVDINYYTPQLNAPSHPHFVFLLVARMLKDKGVVEFVTAARMLKLKYPNVEFQLLGFVGAKNPSAITLEEMQAWEQEGIINYLGESDSVIDFLRRADCVVLPSYREGVPRSLLEAASVGKPIVTTNAIGCREVVDHGMNGYLCKVKDADDLSLQMEKMLLLTESERKQMGVCGREKMVTQFSEQLIIDRYVETIAGLLEPKKNRLTKSKSPYFAEKMGMGPH